jgi:hypothetical protein
MEESRIDGKAEMKKKKKREEGGEGTANDTMSPEHKQS